jgi:pimeloyl-ACP methyl ester carboxylesterase
VLTTARGHHAVLEAGVGGRPLLLLHGWTGAKEDFEDWVSPLGDAGWHVVAPDHRGHGGSHKPESEEDYSFAILAQDALAVADALAWETFVLLGHSMGGMVAQHVALVAGDRLDARVLMDTHHGPLELDPGVVAAGVDAARTHGTDAIATLLEAATEPGPLDTPAHRRLCAERPGYAQRGPTTTRATSAPAFAALLFEIANGPDRLAELASCAMPVLVLVGDQDTPFVEPSRSMAAAVEGATLVEIPEAGHSPQFEAPQRFWEAMSAFLETLPATRATGQGG